MKRLIVLNIVFVLLFALAVNKDVKAADLSGPTPVVFGVSAPLTGPASAYGIPFGNGVRLMDGKVFKVGGKDYVWKVVTYDDRYDPSTATITLNKLLFEDKATFLYTMCSPAKQGFAHIIESNPAIDWNWTFWVAGKYRHIIDSWPSDIVADGAFYFAKENWPNIKSVSTISPASESGQKAANDGVAAAKRYGFTVASSEFYDPKATDFYPLLTGIMRKQADCIYLAAVVPGTCGLILKQLHELGWNKPVFSSEGASAEKLVGIAGVKAVEDYLVVCTSDYDASAPIFSDKEHEFYKKYVEKYGKYHEGAQAVYVGAELFMQAMNKAGVIGKDMVEIDKIINILAKEEFDWTYPGKTKMGHNDKYGPEGRFIMPLFCARMKGGKWDYFRRISVDEVMKLNLKLHPEWAK